MTKQIIKSVKEAIRFNNSHGYPRIVIMKDGGVICPECAKSNFRLIVQDTKIGCNDSWQAVGSEIHYEGAAIQCDHCNKMIESAYGEYDENQ